MFVDRLTALVTFHNPHCFEHQRVERYSFPCLRVGSERRLGVLHYYKLWPYRLLHLLLYSKDAHLQTHCREASVPGTET